MMFQAENEGMKVREQSVLVIIETKQLMSVFGVT